MKVTLDDLDDLISALSPEELRELSCVDPDVSLRFSASLHTYIHVILYIYIYLDKNVTLII